jgi:hypothetical protein
MNKDPHLKVRLRRKLAGKSLIKCALKKMLKGPSKLMSLARVCMKNFWKAS